MAPVSLGTAAGLFVGKQVGIFGPTLLAVRLGIAPEPGGASRVMLYGVSILLDQAKLGILLGSLAAEVAGFAILRLTSPDPMSS